jgi:hypothetical protein
MSIEQRVKNLEQQSTAGQPRVVWVNQDETPAQACERQGIRYDNPMMIDTGIDKVLFVGWRK